MAYPGQQEDPAVAWRRRQQSESASRQAAPGQSAARREDPMQAWQRRQETEKRRREVEAAGGTWGGTPGPAQGSRSSGAPPVRSGGEALGEARRYIDGALMAGFGVFLLVLSGQAAEGKSGLVIAGGIGCIVYGAYIAFLAASYIMPYFVYALAILGGLAFIFS